MKQITVKVFSLIFLTFIKQSQLGTYISQYVFVVLRYFVIMNMWNKYFLKASTACNCFLVLWVYYVIIQVQFWPKPGSV